MSSAAQADPLDPDFEAIANARRRRRVLRPPTREWAVGGAIAAAVGAAAVMLPLLPSDRAPVSLPVLLVFVGIYAALVRARWETGAGAALPTELALVPMLFVLPPLIVPACVVAGLVVGRLLDGVPTRRQLERLPLVVGSGWHAVPPALVLWAAGEPDATWRHVPWLFLALTAQVVGDFSVSAAHDRIAYGVSPRKLLRYVRTAYVVDLALAPLGYVVAIAALDAPFAVVAVLPLAGLLSFFARERRARIDNALELSHAYRGTALLLGDVVEADDAYTGSHSRDVVDLVLGVCDALKVDARTRRDAEFVALLHDVGKIRVPGEIINKPGSLDDAEWAVMKRHTIEGERMLSGVGGLLAQVGSVVRSCHERWDGGGYPDGLAAEEIPLIARIVMACDAYSAMTSDRSYRRAMSREAAVEELRVNAGTQFDPRVVDALLDATR